MNLLEKAKSNLNPNKKLVITKEEVELALAWVRGEITIPQVCFAIGKSQAGQGHSFLLKVLRYHINSTSKKA